MLGSIKKFVKKYIVNESHPFFWRSWQKHVDRMCERHSRMTYAEIEKAISRQHLLTFGRKLNWDNPQTYNEKIHVSKVYMPSPFKAYLTDKVAVREWITEKIGSEYLIPHLGVYDSFDEIDFDALPDSFVMKCNHDSGSVTLVKDKSRMNRAYLRRKFKQRLRRNCAWVGWEMHCRDIVPKLIVEQYMGDAVRDYKFQCFNGEPYSCRIDYDRFGDHRRDVYDMNWEIMPFMKGLFEHPVQKFSCPTEYEEMKRIARELSRDIDQVRVDLYLIDGHIYFGEMTFTNGCGFECFVPDEWDYKLGALWPFDNSVRTRVLAHSSRP